MDKYGTYLLLRYIHANILLIGIILKQNWCIPTAELDWLSIPCIAWHVFTYIYDILKFKPEIKEVHTVNCIVHSEILVRTLSSCSLSGIPKIAQPLTSCLLQLKYAGSFPYYAGNYAGITLYAFMFKICWHNWRTPITYLAL